MLGRFLALFSRQTDTNPDHEAEPEAEPEQRPAPVLNSRGAGFQAIKEEQVKRPEKHDFRAIEPRDLERAAEARRADLREGFEAARDEATAPTIEAKATAPANDNTPQENPRDTDAEERHREKMRQELEREKERRRQARQHEREGRTH